MSRTEVDIEVTAAEIRETSVLAEEITKIHALTVCSMISSMYLTADYLMEKRKNTNSLLLDEFLKYIKKSIIYVGVPYMVYLVIERVIEHGRSKKISEIEIPNTTKDTSTHTQSPEKEADNMTNRIDKPTEVAKKKYIKRAKESKEFETFRNEFDYSVEDSNVIQVNTDDGDVEYIVSFTLDEGNDNINAELNITIRENTIRSAKFSIERLDDEGLIEDIEVYQIEGGEVEEMFTP